MSYSMQNWRNNEDLSAEALPDVLEKFAIMRGLGKKRELYEYDEVDTIEELYELSNLSDYVEKHRGDTSLENVLRTSLEHLVRQPFDQACTKRLAGVNYEIDLGKGPTQRSPMRFSPQYLPGIPKGPIASATRIIYDVVRVDSKPTLMVYGAFIKQDINEMSQLPRRR